MFINFEKISWKGGLQGFIASKSTELVEFSPGLLHRLISTHPDAPQSGSRGSVVDPAEICIEIHMYCLYIYIYIYTYIYIYFVYLFVYLSMYLFIYLLIYLFIV